MTQNLKLYDMKRNVTSQRMKKTNYTTSLRFLVSDHIHSVCAFDVEAGLLPRELSPSVDKVDGSPK